MVVSESTYGLLRLEAMAYQQILVDITSFKHQSNRSNDRRFLEKKRINTIVETSVVEIQTNMDNEDKTS